MPMLAELWWMIPPMLFYLGVQICLTRGSQCDLDQASMLPFADDLEAARRVERETGRSTTGCTNPGTCDGRCHHIGRQQF